jgi:hypothetical protein
MSDAINEKDSILFDALNLRFASERTPILFIDTRSSNDQYLKPSFTTSRIHYYDHHNNHNYDMCATTSHHHTITPSHHHTITPSHHHTITPSHHHTITPSHHHTIVGTVRIFEPSEGDMCGTDVYSLKAEKSNVVAKYNPYVRGYVCEHIDQYDGCYGKVYLNILLKPRMGYALYAT